MDRNSLNLDLGQVREIATALTHTWDVPLLLFLAHGPRRFMDIKRSVAVPPGRRPDARVLKDTLERLVCKGYVERVEGADGQPYAITARARRLLVRLQAIVECERQTALELEHSCTPGH